MVKENNAFKFDHFVLMLWLGHLMINVIQHAVVASVGGMINLLLFWFFMFYFVLCYSGSVYIVFGIDRRYFEISHNRQYSPGSGLLYFRAFYDIGCMEWLWFPSVSPDDIGSPKGVCVE